MQSVKTAVRAVGGTVRVVGLYAKLAGLLVYNLVTGKPILPR